MKNASFRNRFLRTFRHTISRAPYALFAVMFVTSTALTSFAKDQRYDQVTITEKKDTVPTMGALSGEYALLHQQNIEKRDAYIKTIPELVKREFAERLEQNRRARNEAADYAAAKRAYEELEAIQAEMSVRENELKNKALEKFAKEEQAAKNQIVNKRIAQYAALRMTRNYKFHMSAWDKPRPFGPHYYCVIPHLDCVYPKGEWIYTKNVRDSAFKKPKSFLEIFKGYNDGGIHCTRYLNNLEVKVVDGKSVARQPLPGSQDGTGPLNQPASGINIYASLKGRDYGEGTVHADLTFSLIYSLEDSVCRERAERDCAAIF